MIMKTKFIPHSMKRYTINENGEIFDDGIKLIPEFIDGFLKVKINWLSRIEYIPISLLQIVTFLEMKITDDDWLKIHPIYLDGNPNNLKLNNLSYRFTELIENPNKPGFYHIPFYTGYLMNSQGEMFSTYSNKMKSWAQTKPNLHKNSKGGYYYTRLKANLNGKSKIVFRHRLLMYTFTEYPVNLNAYVVNHKNGVPGDDNIDNLEWSTYLENNNHSYRTGLKPNSTQGIKAKDLNSGEIFNFISVADCARHFNIKNPTMITYRIKHCPNRVFEDKLLFKYTSDDSDWDEVDLTDIKGNGKVRTIIARNVFTKQSYLFSSANDAAKFTMVSPNSVLKHAKEELLFPTNGFNFRFADYNVGLPLFTDDQLVILKETPYKPKNGYYVTNVNTGKKTIYSNIHKLCDGIGISRNNVHIHLDKNILFRKVYKLETLDIYTVQLTSNS